VAIAETIVADEVAALGEDDPAGTRSCIANCAALGVRVPRVVFTEPFDARRLAARWRS